MAVPVSTVTVEIVGGISLAVPWVAGMSAQTALEEARDIAPPGALSFALEYFGSALGYMVVMANGTYESLLPGASPNYYWDFLVNDVPSNVGIDAVQLQPGDKASFRFDQYNPVQHAQTTMAIKYNARTSNLS